MDEVEAPTRASAAGRGQSRKAPCAVILAGGRGTRLAPLTTVLPKPLMPLGDGPILDTLVRQLRSQGWREVTLAVGHMADLVRAYCGSGSRWDVRLRYAEEREPLGTVGPLATLPAAMRERPLLVMNGDLLTTLRFADFVRAHRASGAVASIALHRRVVPMEFGVAELDGAAGPERRIIGFREKPSLRAVVSMGVYVLEPEAVGYIRPGERMDLPELIVRLIEDGRLVGGYEFDGYWLDIGRHDDYQKALEDYEALRPHLLPEPAVVAA